LNIVITRARAGNKQREPGMKNIIFKKIMVAAEGSESVKRAVDSAIEIAKLSETKLYAYT
jgi:hypothetical protein